MPNWVTNKVQAPSHVIRAMLNAEGRIDFETAAPFPGPFGEDWDGIFLDAVEAAEILCGGPVNAHPLMVALEAESRRRFDIKKLSDESFDQFVGMVRNWRACGYLHGMDFARKVWGTKWNAGRGQADPDAGMCEFETASTCPLGVLLKVSERFPDDAITVTYADEEIGSNCGTFTLKGGQIVSLDIAPSWSDMDDAAKAHWKAFAHKVKGSEPEAEDE